MSGEILTVNQYRSFYHFPANYPSCVLIIVARSDAIHELNAGNDLTQAFKSGNSVPTLPRTFAQLKDHGQDRLSRKTPFNFFCSMPNRCKG